MVAEKPIVSHNDGFNKVLFSSVDIFFKKWSKKDCKEATLNTCLHGAEVPAAVCKLRLSQLKANALSLSGSLCAHHTPDVRK